MEIIAFYRSRWRRLGLRGMFSRLLPRLLPISPHPCWTWYLLRGSFSYFHLISATTVSIHPFSHYRVIPEFINSRSCAPTTFKHRESNNGPVVVKLGQIIGDACVCDPVIPLMCFPIFQPVLLVQQECPAQ